MQDYGSIDRTHCKMSQTKMDAQKKRLNQEVHMAVTRTTLLLRSCTTGTLLLVRITVQNIVFNGVRFK